MKKQVKIKFPIKARLIVWASGCSKPNKYISFGKEEFNPKPFMNEPVLIYYNGSKKLK